MAVFWTTRSLNRTHCQKTLFALNVLWINLGNSNCNYYDPRLVDCLTNIIYGGPFQFRLKLGQLIWKRLKMHFLEKVYRFGEVSSRSIILVSKLIHFIKLIMFVYQLTTDDCRPVRYETLCLVRIKECFQYLTSWERYLDEGDLELN